MTEKKRTTDLKQAVLQERNKGDKDRNSCSDNIMTDEWLTKWMTELMRKVKWWQNRLKSETPQVE